MKQANSKTITVGSLRPASRSDAAPHIGDDHALFLRCVLQCQNDFPTKPPGELGLPRLIGVVVDYDYVKRMMFTMLPRDGNTARGLAKHRERAKQACKIARTRLMEAGIVGVADPFIWWTGKPVQGVRETIRRTLLSEAPL